MINKLLVVGSLAYDTIKTPFNQINKTLGGSGSYFSLSASNFIKPALVGVVGDDFRSSDFDLLKKFAETSGIQKAPGKTFHWSGKYSFDLNSRETLKTELGVFANFKPSLSPAHKKAEYIFLGNIHPKLQLEVLRQIEQPKFVGLDTMNFWMNNSLKDLKKVLKQVDVLIINDSEARQFSGEHNLRKAAKKILGSMRAPKGKLPPALIIKRGEYGLLMFTKNKIFNLPGFPLEDVVDPTGAGDSFAGGLMGYLTKTGDTSFENLKQAAVFGSVMASFCVEKLATQRLQNLSADEITKRYHDFKTLTHFETIKI